MCNCYNEINEKLAEHNTQLTPAVTYDKKTGRMGVAVKIATEKMDSHKRQGPVAILGQFCPFCGEKIEVS